MKRSIAVIAALALAAAFTACGSVDESSVTEKKSPIVSQSAEEEKSGSDASVTADEAEKLAESAADVSEAAVDESSDQGVETHIVETDTDMPDYSLANDAQFNGPDGTVYTYGELRNYGYANYSDGYFYCIVPEGGGAGSVFYSLHYSADGTNWETGGDFLQMLNGEADYFGMDNGTIVKFEYKTAENNILPNVINYTFDPATYTLSSETYTGLFDGLFTLADGSPVTEDSDLRYDIGYGGGRTFGCTVIDNTTGDTLYDGQITLPEE